MHCDHISPDTVGNDSMNNRRMELLTLFTSNTKISRITIKAHPNARLKSSHQYPGWPAMVDQYQMMEE
jgi:hypothetical protein